MKAGFSLIETIIACALLGCVLVPAFAAFRAHLAAVESIEAGIDTRIQVENLRARLYADALSPSNAPAPATFVTRLSKTIVAEPVFLESGSSGAYKQPFSIDRVGTEHRYSDFAVIYPPATTNSQAQGSRP